MSNIPKSVQPGDFFCVQGSSKSGRWIGGAEFIDGATPEASQFQHVAMVVSVAGTLLRIVEAEGQGAVEVPFHYPGQHIIWSTGFFYPTTQQRRRIVSAARQFAIDKIGYSYLDYLSLTAHHYHLPIPGLQEYIKSSGHVICSQLVDRACNIGGEHLFRDGRWDGDVKPSDLSQLLLDRGAKPLGPSDDSWSKS
jgi:hypothetical protein